MAKKSRTQAEVLHRLPYLVAHLIAESLGYFTPQSAANAIAYRPVSELCLLSVEQGATSGKELGSKSFR